MGHSDGVDARVREQQYIMNYGMHNCYVCIIITWCQRHPPVSTHDKDTQNWVDSCTLLAKLIIRWVSARMGVCRFNMGNTRPYINMDT